MMNALKSLRTAKNLSQADLGKLLNVGQNTISNWEKNKTEPDYDSLVEISKYFGVPLDYLLGYGVFENWQKILDNRDAVFTKLQKDIPAGLEASDSEKYLIAQLDEWMFGDFDEISLARWFSYAVKSVTVRQKTIEIHYSPEFQAVISSFASHKQGEGQTKADKLAVEFARLRSVLNDDGMDQFLNYGRYLAQQPELQRKNSDNVIDLPMLNHYFTGPAAGKASPIQGEDYEEIPYPEDAPRGADFCVDVSGDSMEPYIKNGSRVYVRRGVSLSKFDTGVFFYGGDVYVKQICEDYTGAIMLLSANPLREDCNIRIDKDNLAYLVCYGKVLLPHRLPEPDYSQKAKEAIIHART